MSVLDPKSLDRRLSVAPMMDWTDRHCRYFLRLVAPHALLYTEMVHTGAILRGDRARHLAFDPAEQPVALQLGGADPDALGRCAEIGAQWGYAEVNLNCGCPSERVQAARFGACLMAEPALVARAVAAMVRAAGGVPVTVKCRIGLDDSDEYGFVQGFAHAVVEAGAAALIVHARKAWLKGLSPKENREIPPLRYDIAARLKAELPVPVVLNGGLTSAQTALDQLATFDGVMLGRAAYQTPMVLAETDARLYGTPMPDRHAIVDALLPYIEAERARGTPLAAITRHLMGLFVGQPGGRAWRRHLSEEAHAPGAGTEVIEAAARLTIRDLRAAA